MQEMSSSSVSAELSQIQARFERFARVEAPGRSETYRQWAELFAERADYAEVLLGLAPPKRQPPLVFAVLRMLESELSAPWQSWLLREQTRVRAECARALLQSNEVNRTVLLAIALSEISEEITLIELGASAGLCLFPDRFGYRFFKGEDLVRSFAPSEPGVASGARSDLSGELYLSTQLLGGHVPNVAVPKIQNRIGVDLEPLDLHNPAQQRWLRTLLWPGETLRQERMDTAIELVLAERFRMFQADASAALDVLAPELSRTNAVVSTLGLLVHLPYPARVALLARLLSCDVDWVSLDPPDLILLDETHQRRCWRDVVGEHPVDASLFVLSLNGEALAWCNPLGESVEMLERGRFRLLA